MISNLRKTSCLLALSCVILGMLTVPCHGESTPVFQRYFDELQHLIKEEVITEGSFRELNIGKDKHSVLISLQNMGIIHVNAQTRDVITVIQASNLDELKYAKSVRIDGSAVMIGVLFSGDNIEKIVAPPHTEWERIVRKLNTRDDVFYLFSEILNSDPKAYARNIGFELGWATLDPISDRDRIKLDDHDLWTANFHDDGYWHIKLEFDKNLLQEIIVMYSPVELP